MKIFDFNFAKYRKIRATPPEWAMDVRHVKLLHNLLLHSPANRYAEIGCCGGVSTTAAVEALRAGKQCQVDLCDLVFTPTLVALTTQWLRSGRLRLHQKSSADFLRENRDLDFVFLDGDHSLTTVQDELHKLLKTKVRYIAAHDTSALERALAHGMPEEKFSGPAYLREQLQYLPGWYCLEERRRREKEATIRGFFFATNDREFFTLAQKLFRYWAEFPFSAEYDCRYDPNFGKFTSQGGSL